MYYDEDYSYFCKQLFGKDEREHLEEVLHGDLDGYWEEIKDMKDKEDFYEWKDLSNMMLQKCGLNTWEGDRE